MRGLSFSSDLPSFCRTVFFIDLVVCSVRTILLIFGIGGYHFLLKTPSSPIFPSSWIEIFTSTWIVIFGLSGNTLMLFRKPWALSLGYLNVLASVASIGGGVWLARVGLQEIDSPYIVNMIGGSILIRVLFVSIYLAALTKFASWCQETKQESIQESVPVPEKEDAPEGAQVESSSSSLYEKMYDRLGRINRQIEAASDIPEVSSSSQNFKGWAWGIGVGSIILALSYVVLPHLWTFSFSHIRSGFHSKTSGNSVVDEESLGETPTVPAHTEEERGKIRVYKERLRQRVSIHITECSLENSLSLTYIISEICRKIHVPFIVKDIPESHAYYGPVIAHLEIAELLIKKLAASKGLGYILSAQGLYLTK